MEYEQEKFYQLRCPLGQMKRKDTPKADQCCKSEYIIWRKQNEYLQETEQNGWQ